MPGPRDFLPARPPFLPMPETVIRYGLNEYMEMPITAKGAMTAEEKLLAAIFSRPKAILTVKCRGCGKWLEDDKAIYLNNLAYHSECAAKIYGGE